MSALGALLLTALVAAPGEREPARIAARFTAAGPTASELAEALLAALGGPGFSPGATLALSARAPAGDLAEDLERALVPRLLGLGARHVELLPAPATPRAARDAGAEIWLDLTVEAGDRPTGAALRVLRVDRGLWAPSSTPELLADARIERVPEPSEASRPSPDLAPPAAQPRPEPRPEPTLVLGPAAPLLEWPRPVWALALCPADEEAASRLLVLDAREVAVLDLEGPRPRILGRAPLDERRRSPTPIRAPFGAIRCGPPGRAAVGHGRLARGLELRFHPRLEIVGPLEGFPVGPAPGGWWLARLAPGLPRLETEVRGPGGQALALEGPVLELHLEGDPPRGFAVTPNLELRPVMPTGAFGVALGSAGAGLGAAWAEGALEVAVTAAGADEELELRRGGATARRPLDAPARAIGVGAARGRWGLVAAVDAPRGRARLLWVPVEGAR